MRKLKSFIPVPEIIYKHIRLYRLNRLFLIRLIHLFKNISPKNKICKVCNWSGKEFVDGTRCPICFSLPRHRLMIHLLKEIDCNKKKILIIGPDMPELLIMKKIKFDSITNLNMENSIFTDVVADITKYSLDKKSFDMVIMWHVLEHIEEDIVAVNNIFNLLRDDGIFLFSVPVFPWGNKVSYIPEYTNLEDKIEKMGHHDHVLCCGEDYGDRFELIKFKEKRKINVNSFKQKDIDTYHLDINHYAWLFIK